MSQELTIDFRLVEIALEITTLKEHITLIEEHISHATEEAMKKRDDGLRSLTSDSDYEYESDMLNFEYGYFTESFLPRVYRSPFIVGLFAVYETSVKEIAELIGREKGLTVGLNTRGGNSDFLTKAIAHYRDVLGMELSRNEENLKRLEVLRNVRNVIAHNNGRFEMASEKQRQVLRMEKLANGYGWILVPRAFLSEMHNVVNEELGELVAMYKAWDSDRNKNC
ncbi:MAG: hypothetical protein OXC99_12550 [Chloroflexi bacterium]|nr:hypothetical protein [Chloroflexota bacterium]